MKTPFAQLLIAVSLLALPLAAPASTQAATTRCDAIGTTTDAQAKYFRETAASHKLILDRAHERLAGLVGHALAQHYDATKLQADEVELTRRTQRLADDYAAVQQALAATRAQCGAPDPLTAAASHLKAARDDRTALAAWVTTTLVSDMNAIKKQEPRS